MTGSANPERRLHRDKMNWGVLNRVYIKGLMLTFSTNIVIAGLALIVSDLTGTDLKTNEGLALGITNSLAIGIGAYRKFTGFYTKIPLDRALAIRYTDNTNPQRTDNVDNPARDIDEYRTDHHEEY